MKRDKIGKTPSAPTILGSGLIALDLVLSSNSDVPIRNYAGGTCGNVLTILSFFGWNSYPLARIGTDAAAMYLTSDLGRWNVKLEFLLREGGILTPVILQQNRRTKTGEVSHRFSWQCPSCGSFWPSFRPPTRKYAESLSEKLQRHNVFFFDRVSPATLKIAELSATAGAVVMFEPAGMGDEKLFVKALSTSTIVKYSTDRIARLPRNIKPPLEIRTLGKDGLEFRRSSTRKWKRLPAVPVDSIVDTSGSGDWVTAGLLKELCHGGIRAFSKHSDRTIIEALRVGQALASWNCRFEGARGGMYQNADPASLAKRVRSILGGFDSGTAHDDKQGLISLAVSIGDICRKCAEPRQLTVQC